MKQAWKISISYFLLTITFYESFGQECERLEWKCKNGECIAMDELCDGRPDCRDKSDETAEECVHVRCPSYAFRCAYGACVSGDAECNGKKDCADNSDETTPKCPGSLNNVKPQGNCSNDEFQCSNGNCIPTLSTCDGKVHCTDGSDETVTLCASIYCPKFAFRCGYGACISGSSRCNGVIECNDGSDESAGLCDRDHEITSSNIGTSSSNEVPRPRPKPSAGTTSRTSTTTQISISGCKIDYDHPNLIFVYEADTNEQIRPGVYIDAGTSISYKCPPKHFLDEQKINVCLGDGVWISNHPSCTKYCSNTIINSVTIQATCEYNGARIPCNQPLKVGTRATIACQIGYTKPDRVVQETLLCDEDGEWNYHPFRCEQVCGTEPPQGKPFIIGGEKINNTLVPWHVGIYRLRPKGYEQICAGTIINAKVVISAAHCFWDLRNEKSYDTSLFQIAAGKYYRDYNAREPLLAQFFNISELHIARGYKDVLLSYVNDIAVIVLNNYIVFKTHIKPICIEWQDYGGRSMKSDQIGRVAGWGKTESGNPSPELQVADLPTLSYDDCLERAQPQHRTLVTGDKFCVITTNGRGVCEGDSGGGFALAKIVGGVRTYFLWGIVSIGLNTNINDCAGSYFTAFTNIQYYSEMIIEYESKYRPK